jgi:hypothetical protein
MKHTHSVGREQSSNALKHVIYILVESLGSKGLKWRGQRETVSVTIMPLMFRHDP